MAQMKVKIQIPEELTERQRRTMALEIIETIYKRTSKKGLDKNGQPFKPYSDSYASSADFKISGKRKGKVTLELSGDMLADLELLSSKKGELVIGYEKGSESNGKAEGNIKGTYGNPRPVSAKRDFLGITDDELDKITRRYETERKAENRANKIEDIYDLAEQITGQILIEG